TESLGNNKAPACESRGFVRKIMKVCILTHLLCFLYTLTLYPKQDSSTINQMKPDIEIANIN
ncbi:hypothetical protein KSW97_16355, partial [Bacteroides stercoris]|nr:hypothetical protein [Bacteroides stercoris]MBV3494224.1 hypothetical protein [Bacteroides stercoris]